MKYRKIMACLLASFILLSTALCPLAEEPSSGGQTTTSGPEEAVFAQPFDVSAESVYMVNLDTGLVMYSKNPQKRWPPASLTKMMTAILAFENIPDLDNTMITMPRYIQDLLYGTNSSTADIRPGETLSARELLYALLLPSANEAACILADYIGGGSIDNFVFMMNAKAKEIGCTDTNFANPHGLYDANHYSTAYDQYLIAKYAMNLPGFMDIVTQNTHTLPQNSRYPNGWVILSTNKMQMTAFKGSVYRSYIRGIKTGTLPEAGANFVSTASQNGENYLTVVLGATGSETYPHFAVTAQLCDWAFENYSVRSALDTAEPLTEISVKYSSDADKVLLYPKTDLLTLLPNESDQSSLQKVYNLPAAASAPLKAGDTVGSVTLYLAGKQIGTVDLVAANDVSRNFLLFVVSKIGEFLGSLYFRVVLVLVLLVVAVYVGYLLYTSRKNQKMRKVKRRHK